MKCCLVCYKYGVPLDDPCCYPLGFMYVSSVFKRNGHDVKVLNYNLFDYDFVAEIKDQDIVLFTGFEEFATLIVRDAKICKELGVYTVLGGALANYLTDTMLKYVDEVFVGEFPTGVHLDSMPLPDYIGFGIVEYQKRHKNNFMGVLTATGCPYSCSFCSQVCKFEMRSLSRVFGEIMLYKLKYDVDTIVFYDNTFNVSKKRFMKICAWMKGRGLSWSASIRCSPFDEEMARAAKKSGCIYFVIGVESFTQAKLDAMNKQIKVSDIHRTIGLLQKFKIR